MKVQEILLSQIRPDPDQPRKDFSEQSLKRLADSLQRYGLIQPILLRKDDQKNQPAPSYIIIAGERRFRAAKMAGFTRIASIIRDKAYYQELSLVENIQRQDLSPIEQANALKTYMQEHAVTQEEMAAIISKSRSYVANSLRLLRLPKQVKDWVDQGRLSDGHARALLSEKDSREQVMIAKQILDNDWSVRKTEAYTRAKKNKEFTNPYEIEAIREIEEALATKISVDSSKSGTIRIHFFNPAHKHDLMTKLLEVLTDGV